jgi:hypothetical protein
MRTIKTYSKRAPFYNALSGADLQAPCLRCKLEKNEKVLGILRKSPEDENKEHVLPRWLRPQGYCGQDTQRSTVLNNLALSLTDAGDYAQGEPPSGNEWCKEPI